MLVIGVGWGVLVLQPTHRIVVCLMLLAILSPDVTILPGLPQFRLEEWFIYTLVPFIFLTRRRALDHAALPVLAYFAATAVVVLLSVAHSVVMLGAEFVLRDLTDVAQMLKYWGLAWLVGTVEWNQERLRTVGACLVLGFAAAAVWGMQQRWDLVGLNTTAAVTYTSGEHQAIAIASGGRVFGTSGNPNEFGCLMTMGAALGLSLLGTARDRRLPALLLVVVCSAAVVLTGSRGSLLALVATTGAALAAAALAPAYRRSAGAVAVGLVVISAVVASTIRFVPYLDDLPHVLEDPTQDASFTNRWLWGFPRAVDLWARSPVLGWGPAKETIASLYDSQYYYTLSRFGLVGCALLGALIIVPTKWGAVLLRKGLGWEARTLGSWLLLGGVAQVIINVTNLTLSRFQFMDLWTPVLVIGAILQSQVAQGRMAEDRVIEGQPRR